MEKMKKGVRVVGIVYLSLVGSYSILYLKLFLIFWKDNLIFFLEKSYDFYDKISSSLIKDLSLSSKR